MNSNSKSHKSSSIFIAAVLVAGLIAIASPSITFAEDDYKEYNEYDSYDQPYTHDDYKEYNEYDSYDQPYTHDDYKEYNEYDSYDQPYKQDKKYEKPGGGYNKAECSVSNFNIDDFTDLDAQIVKSFLTQTENNAESSDENINSIEGTDGSNGIGSNGAGKDRNGGGGLELDFENICLNFGDNDQSGTVGNVP